MCILESNASVLLKAAPRGAERNVELNLKNGGLQKCPFALPPWKVTVSVNQEVVTYQESINNLPPSCTLQPPKLR